jgi:hypothetical protein
MSDTAAPSAAPSTPSPAPAAPAKPTPTPTPKPDAAAKRTVTFEASPKGGAAAKPTSPQTTKTGAGAAARAEAAAAATPAEGEGTETAEPKPPEKRKFKYKANKEEVEEELTDEEIAVRLAKVRGSERAFQERAELERAVADFFTKFKADPWAISKEVGLDLDALAQQRLAEAYERRLEEEKLSPEAREAKAAKEEAEKYRKQLEAIENQKRSAAEQEFRTKIEQETSATLEAALGELGVDATPESLADAARVMKLNLQHKIRLTPKQIALEVQRMQSTRHERFHKAVLGGLKGEKLLQYLGGVDSPVLSEILSAIPHDSAPAKKLIAARLAALKKPEPFVPPAPAAGRTRTEPDEKPREAESIADRYARRMANKRAWQFGE